MVIAICLAVLGLPAPTQAASNPVPSCAKNISTPVPRDIEPVDNGVLKVARIAASDSSDAEEWEIALDVWWCNPTTSTYTTGRTTFEFLNALGATTGTRSGINTGDLYIDPNQGTTGYSRYRFLNEADQNAFPLPHKIRVTILLRESTEGDGPSDATVTKTFDVAEHMNPDGGYLPPFRQYDLDPDMYWTQTRHSDSNYQRWGYDLGVSRWTGSGWSSLREGGSEANSADYNSWERPVYAMSDGEIIGCNRGANDNMVPGIDEGNVAGGNLIWLRTGDETTLYAHLRKNSIPIELCPFTDDAEHKLADPFRVGASDHRYTVKAGDFLGLAGNSGSSTGGPHLHVHVFKGLPAIWAGQHYESGIRADGRPLRLFGLAVHPRQNGELQSDLWSTMRSPAQLPYHTRVFVDPCGLLADLPDDDEEVRIDLSPNCFTHAYNLFVTRGYRPTHIDVGEAIDGPRFASVWRRDTGVPWTLHYDLTESDLEALLATTTMRPLEIESYRTEPSGLRFALIQVAATSNDPSQTEFFAQTPTAFANALSEQAALGRHPVSISVTEVNDVAYRSGIFQEADVGSAFVQVDIPLADFPTVFDQQDAAGRGLSWLESHVVDLQVRIAAAWYDDLEGPYATRTSRTLTEIEADLEEHVSNGGYTRALTGHSVRSDPLYGGLWRAAPESTILTGPKKKTGSRRATFTFSATDPFAEQECRIDTGRWKPCTGTFKAKNLGDGKHVFRVKARSRDGVPEPVYAAWKWTVQS